jgi:polysaccharide pyruvyl transferase WcaK-like protein
VDDLRAVFGEDVPITIGTLNRENTLRTIEESPTLKVLQVPYVCVAAIWRETKDYDIVMLVEGSTFKDSWSSALLYVFLWGAWSANRHGKFTVAYAVDAGHMRPINRALTRLVCADIDLIITRSAAAREELRSVGVSTEIVVTADTSFQYRPSTPSGPETTTVGFAPVEFNMWPVRIRLFGRKRNCYHWPYYYSWNARRAARSRALVAAWAGLITDVVSRRGWDAELIAMDEVDVGVCNQILDVLAPDVRARTRTIFADEAPPLAIVSELRQLSYLVTSRYHAAVLSMEASVPQMALYGDERLLTIYRELDLEDHALCSDTVRGDAELIEAFERLVQQADQQRGRLRSRLDDYFLPKCLQNRSALASWARSIGMLSEEVAG